ncbi:tetratricopeptide repeat-containing sensor histidine kinase [Pedobacter sp. SYP-B3415]|uniref:tetratricopeptide repeat-containing sensor histidine kinase n=1 Tax=Pedobacter sp. SYP-B3415 TaxID=2496641 RepID=UPI00101C598A|nr:tetratricopeptide repeat-containing sensor histidine kinase [Pedobacter sp. SYP-B3415]
MPEITQRLVIQIRLFFFILLLPLSVFSQQKTADSLVHALSKARPDTAKVWLYFNLGRQYYTSDTEKALDFARKGLALAQDLHFEKGEAKTVNLIGVCQLILSQFDESLKSHYHALSIREKMRDTVGMMESMINIGNANYRLTNTEEAVKFYKKALTYAIKKNSKPGLALLYNNIGSYYKDRWLSQKKQADYQQAVRFILAARQTKKELNDRKGQANCLSMLAQIYLEKKNYKQALAAFKESLNIHRSYDNKEGEVTALSSIADLYLLQKNNEEAIRYADSAYAVAKSTKSDYIISGASGTVEKVNSALRNYKKAYEMLLQDKARDSQLFAESRQKVREELAIKYQTAQKDKLTKQLARESSSRLATILRKNETQVQAFIAIAFLLILTGFILWSRHKTMRANQKLMDQNRIIEQKNDEISIQNKQIEQQASELKMKNEALVTANMIRNKVFSVISHDLRSPLASLDSILGLIKGGQLDREEMEHFVGLLSDDIDVTQKMLNSLLIWAGTQMDGQSVRREHVALKNIVRENFMLSAKRALEKNISLVNDVPAKAEIYTDREKLNFIVRNIISNALKFTRQGGTISVAWAQHQGRNVLSIKDNGVGMSAEAIESLFSDKRYSTPGTDREKGTGLGMLLCKDFANSIGLRITVESVPEQGSTFFIHLPEDETNVPVSVQAKPVLSRR